MPVLLSRFEDAIEWRLGGPTKVFEAAREHYLTNRRFRRDGAERWAA
ncbi:MAG: hypothetical protein ACREA9_09320 [Pyrinomonadaceae bacterium]